MRMKSLRLCILSGIAGLLMSSMAWPQAAPVQAQSAVIRITSPQQQQRQTANYVDVHYELQNPTSAPGSSPNFKVQLDGNDPVTTTTTEQSFTGLTPGPHVITVQLVDANGTAVPNSETQVQFLVQPTPQNGGGNGSSDQNPSSGGGAQTTSTPPPQAASMIPINGDDTLPEAGSLLPVFSVIGFGLLVGGVVSALKTHPDAS